MLTTVTSITVGQIPAENFKTTRHELGVSEIGETFWGLTDGCGK